jgi:signal transduction histidine kinase
MQLQVYDSTKQNAPDDAKQAYRTATELIHEAHAEARRLISEVRHPVIDERGLESAILNLVYEQQQRSGLEIKCHSSVDFDRLPPILENAIYRMVQEALRNACQHSESEKVTVTLVQEGQDIRLEVRDIGVGFAPGAVGKGHFGLESIRQRARLLGGRLSIDSSPGVGTAVQVVVPIVEHRIDD